MWLQRFLEALRWFYWILTAVKIAQCALLWMSSSATTTTSPIQNEYSAIVTKKGISRKVEMIPSLQIIIRILLEYLLGQEQELSKIPRKDLRQITDPWLRDYNKLVASGKLKSKRFSSLCEAKRDFFRELCNETTGIHVDLTNIAVPFLNYPLGMVSLINSGIFLFSLPLLLLRELYRTKSLQQAPQILLCKLAASKTITDVYALAVRDGIGFEATIHKYPLTADLFHNTQFHPLVGRAACPIYKREVTFPKDDVMDFDFDFVRIPGGQAILRPRHHHSWLLNLWEELLLAHYCVALFVFAFLCGSTNPLALFLQTVGPAAMSFYVIRTLVDWIHGIPCDP